MFERNPRKCNGYILIYKPDYYLSYTDGPNKGYIYEHIYVATNELGRPLDPDEVVHHLDLSRDNNDPANLLVLSRSAHARLHAWMNKCVFIRKEEYPERKCLACGKVIRLTLKYCNRDCESKYKGTSIPSKEELERVIPSLGSLVKVGKKYGVSDNAVRKWLRKYSLPLKASDYSLTS